MKKTLLIPILLLGFFATQKTTAQDSYLGRVLAVGFNYAPSNFAMCNGQLLPINQYSALYSLLGTAYGGNGTTNFALPNLNGRTVVGAGSGPGLSEKVMGQTGGSSNITLTAENIPSHSHSINANTSAGTSNVPTGNVLSNTLSNDKEFAATATTSMSPTGITGSGIPMSTIQPYVGMYYIICINGMFPSRP